ncbi:MAG: M24 family metallopeptidase [Fuerstiella sp.]|nr:M24 family metallopeptidase [Fuerstiella sp.]
MFDLLAIQQALKQFEFDGWLLCDFRGSNLLARRILDIPEDMIASRRYCCFIPASGEPQKIVHRIESGVLNHLPGDTNIYLTWQELESALKAAVSDWPRIAMEYSARSANPYIGRVDAGTVEIVKSFGCSVESSGDLISLFEATLSDDQLDAHLTASVATNEAFEQAWQFIADGIRAHSRVEELEVQQVILQHFSDCGLITDHPPIVAVNTNGGNPHYETGSGAVTVITPDSFVLIDMWARHDHDDGIYSDLTRCGYTGTNVPEYYLDIFQTVAAGRDAGIDFVRSELAAGRSLQGWQVDDVVRGVIVDAGYGEAFCHRTGHSLGRETHGNGTHIDNLETHETRHILPRTLFTIEPGIYLPEFGIRSEVNVFIHADNTIQVTGGEIQQEPHRIV